VAGSEACIAGVVADPGLEAFRVPLEARIDIDGDRLNP
jgi:hypothetical protein